MCLLYTIPVVCITVVQCKMEQFINCLVILCFCHFWCFYVFMLLYAGSFNNNVPGASVESHSSSSWSSRLSSSELGAPSWQLGALGPEERRGG